MVCHERTAIFDEVAIVGIERLDVEAGFDCSKVLNTTEKTRLVQTATYRRDGGVEREPLILAASLSGSTETSC